MIQFHNFISPCLILLKNQNWIKSIWGLLERNSLMNAKLAALKIIIKLKFKLKKRKKLTKSVSNLDSLLKFIYFVLIYNNSLTCLNNSETISKKFKESK